MTMNRLTLRKLADHLSFFRAQLLFGILLSHTSNSFSQEIEEVLVTATKKEGSIQSIAASISAFSGEDMAFRGQSNAQEIAFSVPGLVYGETVGSPQITIRGIGLSVETGVAEMGVATYLNGVFLSRPGLTNMTLGDIGRVEILRGPQGTLYGRNATGGAVNFITNRPTDEYSLYASYSKGSFDLEKYDIALSGPLLNERVLGRVYTMQSKVDGYIENLSEIGQHRPSRGSKDNGYRLSLFGQITDFLELDLNYGYIEKTGNFSTLQITNFVGNVNPLAEGSFTTEPNKVYHNALSYNYLDGELGSLSLTFEADSWYLKSITGYTKHTRDEYYDADGRDPVAGLDANLPNIGIIEGGLFIDTDVVVDRADDYTTLTQEFNLVGDLFYDRVNYVLGLFYMKENGDLKLHSQLGPSTPTPGVNLTGTNLDEDNRSYGVFLDLSISLTESLRALLGARYGEDLKETIQTDYSANRTTFNYNNDGTCDFNEELRYRNFSPKIGLEYDLFTESLAYATYQRATKPGGYNATVCGDEFFEEEVASYEVGFKVSSFQGRLRANTSAYFYDYSNYQVFQLRPPASAEVINAKKSEVKGAEVEIFAKPFTFISFDLGIAYTDARYTEFFGDDGIYKFGGPGEQDLSGNRLARAPEWTANAGIELTIPLSKIRLGELRIRAETAYYDEVYYRQFNIDQDKGDAYRTSNLIVAVTTKDHRIQLKGYIKNIENTEYLITQLSNALEVVALTPDSEGRAASYLGFYGPPRTSGFEISFNF